MKSHFHSTYKLPQLLSQLRHDAQLTPMNRKMTTTNLQIYGTKLQKQNKNKRARMTQRTNALARHQACSHEVASRKSRYGHLIGPPADGIPRSRRTRTEFAEQTRVSIIPLVTYFRKKTQSSFTHTSIERARKSDNRKPLLRKKHRYTKSP